MVAFTFGYKQLDSAIATLKWKDFTIQTTDSMTTDVRTMKRWSRFGIKCQWTSKLHLVGPRQIIRFNESIMPQQRKDFIKTYPYQLLLLTANSIETDTLKNQLLRNNESLGIFHLDLTNSSSLAYMLVLSGQRGINLQGFHDPPDLNGLDIKTVGTLDMPFSSCSNSSGDQGQMEQIFAILAATLNFTWTCHRHLPDGDWGSNPLNGNWSDPKAFHGLYGEIVNGDYDVLMALYGLIEFRTYTTSFLAPVVKNQRSIFINQDRLPVKLDWGFFTRPLHPYAWLVLIFICLVMNICPRLLTIGQRSQLFGLISGLLFTLVQAYFCGVQTQFFTSPPMVPFNTVQEAFGAFPIWKPVVIKGYTIILKQMAQEGMQEMIDLFNRLETSKWSKYKVDSHEEALKMIAREDGTFLYGSDLDVYLAYSKFKTNQFSLQLIATNAQLGVGFITKKYSPLKRIFDQEIINIKENGLGRIQIMTTGKATQLSTEVVDPLSMFQLFSIFLSYLCISIVVFVILAFECYTNNRHL
jgi:hypothetical protein